MKVPFGVRHAAWLGLAGLVSPFRTLRLPILAALTAGFAALLLGAVGCATDSQFSGSDAQAAAKFSDVAQPGMPPPLTNTAAAESVLLREGDTVRISFPGSPTLNTAQQIRRDGKLGLAMVGEVQAAGLTPAQLEKELVKLYGPQLVDKEVSVALDSSAYEVYVTGAVARPGKLMYDRPLTALQALIDAGVDYQKANLKAVRVIRRENGKQTVQILNLKKALEGTDANPFYLKPSDIIFVRERFTWF